MPCSSMFCSSFCSMLMLGLHALMLDIMSMVMSCLDLCVCMHVLCSLHVSCYFPCACALYAMFVCLDLVRTYVFHLLRTYVILLCDWLILWKNALYLYLGRYRMCLILQETCCSSLVLKPWRLDQETSEEKLFIKAGQIARHLRTDSMTAARHLLTLADR